MRSLFSDTLPIMTTISVTMMVKIGRLTLNLGKFME
jgi:hypothetical protein